MQPQSYKKTKLSLSILAFMLIASILYDFIGPEDYRTMLHQLYDENGKLLKAPPYPPSSEFWLGTDRDGRDTLLLIIDGIKYTFAALLAVSFLRVVIGTIMGIIIENWLPLLKPFVKAFFLPFQYVPILLIGVFLMDMYFYKYNQIPVMVKVEYQLIVLFILGFPTVFFFVTDFIKEIKTKSFVTSSLLLGGSKWHIMIRQILPHLKPQMALLFVQQILQTLQIMMGLAMFGIFFGGPHKETIYNSPYTKSITNELSALTGQNY
jgi:peptide/nickel transport system permease protein